MINEFDYKELNRAYKPIFTLIKSKLKKDILISVTMERNGFHDAIVNLNYNDGNPHILIFLGRPGLESFLDINAAGNRYNVSPFEVSYIDIAMKEVSELTEDDYAFFKILHKPVGVKPVTIINNFLRGYKDPNLSVNDLNMLIDTAEVIRAAFGDKSEEKKIKSSNMFLLYLNQKELVYSLYTTDDEHFIPDFTYDKPEANLNIVDELKNLKRVDEDFHLSFTFTSDFTNKNYPLSLIGFGKLDEPFKDAILVDCKKNERKNLIWSYLIEKLTEYGLPNKIQINDYELGNYIIETMKALNVEVVINRVDEFIISYLDDLQVSLFSFDQMADKLDRSNLELYQSFLKTANGFFTDIALDGYDPRTQRVVDNLEDLYGLITDYVNSSNDELDSLDYDNNLVS